MIGRDDGRARLLTIAPGWPARTVARLLEAAAEATEKAAIEIYEAELYGKQATSYTRSRHQGMATPVVESRSDGIAVYAHTETKARASE